MGGRRDTITKRLSESLQNYLDTNTYGVYKNMI
jgi:hypothetical protein